MIEPERLVFVDESAVTTWLGRNYGWSPRGQDAFLTRPFRSERVSVIGALGWDGVRTAVCLEGTVDGDAFLAFLEQSLVPTLVPGDVVVMDNLSVHKVDGVRQIVERAGAHLLYQPRYSPDLNPIEMFWSWAKSRLRDVVARSTGIVQELLGKAMQELPLEFIPQWFKHCGYRHEARSE